MKITKKNGRVVVFDNEKVSSSILKANSGVQGESISTAEAEILAEEVFSRVTEENEIITTADVTKCVCKILKERGYELTAASYLSFAENKNKK